MRRGAVFLDKDGTLVVDVPYSAETGKITFYEGVRESLEEIRDLGYDFFIVSNQPGLGLGLISPSNFRTVMDFFHRFFRGIGIPLRKFYFCPHSEDCTMAKPSPGFLLRASRDFGIDLRSSWMIGDILNDTEAGNRAGCRTVLIDNGNETEWAGGAFREPDFSVGTFREAADVILGSRV